MFLPGAGRSGASAWPGQRELLGQWECQFLERMTVGDDPEAVITDLVPRLGSPVHLVGHSYGGVTALLLAATRPDLVASLTLVEPAALAVCPAAPHTAAHIAALEPVFAQADDEAVSTHGFAARFAAANRSPLPDVTDALLESLTSRLRALRPPWTIPVDAQIVASIPTLVLIGDDGGMYAEVAQVLADAGAVVRVIPGAGHRPHDRTEANDQMVAHWRQAQP